jgi:calcium-dependent protein kinase
MGSCCTRDTITAVKLNENYKIRKEMIKCVSNNRNGQRGSIYQINDENISNVYKMTKKIGRGYFGSVKLGFRINDEKKIYAVKSIDKTKLSAKKIKNLSREIEVLASLDHPNIIKYYETYNDDHYFHIVTEYLSGGELFDKIYKQKRLTEKETANIVYKITSAICHCHSKGIVHRDLKPENILFENKNPDADIKIIDFGLSRKFGEDDLHSIVGSPYYVAPEVLDGNYDYQCDIWGIGAIMYVLLSGKPPFHHENKVELYKKIKNDPLSFNNIIWNGISSDAINLLMLLLNKNPKERPKPQIILENSWFFNYINIYSANILDPEILKSIKNFKQPLRLMKNIFSIITKEVDPREIKNFKEMFMAMDKNKTGFIDLNPLQIQNSVSGNSITININEKSSFKGLADKYNNNKIDYSCFIASSLRKKNLLNKEILHQTFKFLDIDNCGYINVESFNKALKRTGRKKKIEDIEEMFVESGFSKDVKIDFNNFCDFIENCNCL